MSSLVLCIECERDHVVTQSVELLDQSTLIFSVWWAHQDLNLESTDYESGALTNYAIGPEGRGRVTGFACSKHPVEACVVQAVPQTGLPSRTRTCNLRLRRPLHYPVVLSGDMVPEDGLEPSCPIRTRDFKSLVSTNSTTQALI